MSSTYKILNLIILQTLAGHSNSSVCFLLPLQFMDSTYHTSDTPSMCTFNSNYISGHFSTTNIQYIIIMVRKEISEEHPHLGVEQNSPALHLSGRWGRMSRKNCKFLDNIPSFDVHVVSSIDICTPDYTHH